MEAEERIKELIIAKYGTERPALEQADSSLKVVERKKDIRRVLDTKDIFTLDYEQQKAIVRALISKVRVTSETIIVLWKL